MNIKRLKNDHSKLKNFTFRHRDLLKILDTTGHPPTSYRLAFTCKGYTNVDGETSEYHEVVLTLPTNYPAEMPKATFETEIFHPNVYMNGEVCLGFDDRTWRAVIPITTIVAKIGNMIRFSPNTCNLHSKARLLNSPSWEEWMSSHKMPIDEHLYMPDDEDVVIIHPSKAGSKRSKSTKTPTVTIRSTPRTERSTQSRGGSSRQIKIRIKK